MRITILLVINGFILYFIHSVYLSALPEKFFAIKLSDIIIILVQIFIAMIAMHIQRSLVFTNKLVDNTLEEIESILSLLGKFEYEIEKYNSFEKKQEVNAIPRIIKQLRMKESYFLKRLAMLPIKGLKNIESTATTETFNIRNVLSGGKFGEAGHQIDEKKARLCITRHVDTLESFKNKIFKLAFGTSIFPGS